MKRKFKACLSLSLLLLAVQACNSGNQTQNNNTATVKEVDNDTLPGTYEYIGKGDTIRLELNAQQDSVFGKLLYALGEKDRNVGDFKGHVKGGQLIGEYYFMSEGVGSVRDMIFNVTKEGLLEGYGEVEERDGGFRFLDTSKLKFDHGMLLEKK
ncbi:hypothetical protein [Sphingobacterium sp. BN32]|uniref:hypothetical protein n=1 Tax=Sphingobacterium sp. BN32 TaxID=3058432 RepID=UPI00265C9E42|nr:hypothetical protein [Sphingobacterium sp. BN32]WKK57071.1 hypothetical protein QYC40_10480 [Sphingobacterium sp. BN32]